MHNVLLRRVTRQFRLLVFLCVAAAANAQPDIEAFVAALRSHDASARQEAVARAASMGPAALIAVAPLLDDVQPDVVQAAREAIGRVVTAAQPDEGSRKAAANALTIAALATTNRGPLIEHLGTAGGVESLPVLTNLLDEAPASFDAVLGAIARIGGDAAAAKTVCEALVARLDRIEGRHRGTVMHALGALGCSGVEERLIAEVRARTPASAGAADALGEIGGEAALDPLWSLVEKAGTSDALDACLRILGRLPQNRATTWYPVLLRRAPAHLRLAPDDPAHLIQTSSFPRTLCVLLEGIGRTATSAECVDLLLPYLDAKETDIQTAARDALIALQADGATEKLIKKAKKATETRQRTLSEIVDARKINGER